MNETMWCCIGHLPGEPDERELGDLRALGSEPARAPEAPE